MGERVVGPITCEQLGSECLISRLSQFVLYPTTFYNDFAVVSEVLSWLLFRQKTLILQSTPQVIIKNVSPLLRTKAVIAVTFVRMYDIFIEIYNLAVN